MNDIERNKLVDEIRENYGIDVKENLLKLKFERYKQIIFLIIGILSLISSNFFTNHHITLPGQLISIFGWVIIWEFVYSFIFSTIKINIENKRYKKIISAKIHFHKTEKTSINKN